MTAKGARGEIRQRDDAPFEKTLRGQPPYDPRLMVKLLIYGYTVGIPSSRRIEKKTYEDIAFRVLTTDQHPDHDTICDFRSTHRKALSKLFVQVLGVCQEAGLVKLGHVSFDGTKVKANASKHKAMSYARMLSKEAPPEPRHEWVPPPSVADLR